MKSPVLATAAILMVVVCTVMADARPPRQCREGYTAVWWKCYKFVKDRLDWNSAAINCGADGAALARYDAWPDNAMGDFFNNKLHLISDVHTIQCKAGSQCAIPKGRVGISVAVKHLSQKAACKGKVQLSCDKSKVVVQTGCPATSFVVGTSDRQQYYSTKPIVAWIGGNSRVLNVKQRGDKMPFQVDPPRWKPLKTKGCFFTKYGPIFAIGVDPKCEAKRPSICSYDLSDIKTHDPLDFVLIKEWLTHDEAVVKCNALKRPLASIKNAEQQNKLEAMTKGKAWVWLSAKYDRESQKFKWEDGTFLAYRNLEDNSVPTVRAWSPPYCLRVHKDTGKWTYKLCRERKNALCGPAGKTAPLKFTKYFKVGGLKSVRELKEKLLLLQKKDFICENPKVVVCNAKSKWNRWITNEKQASDTLTCTPDHISCKNGKEFDCSTVYARFLCPQEVDQCKELNRLKAPVCRSDQQCYPVSNHYTCRCPPGSIYSESQKKCIKFCGTCSAWGDPHMTTYNNIRYDFMGTCKYKFSGVCNKAEFANRPNFDVYTSQERCFNQFRNDGTCVSEVEVHLRNIPVTSPNGAKQTKDFVFKVSARSDSYTVNGRKVTNQVVVKEGVYKATVRPHVFSLKVYALDLTVFLNGIHVRVQAPETFKGKMCGLCGDCGTDKFRLRNGKLLDIKQHAGGIYDWHEMKKAGLDWLVKDAESRGKKCGVVDVKKSPCSKEQKDKARNEKLCGVFKKNKALQQCFDKTNLLRDHYLWGCVYDVCEFKDPYLAVCEAVKTFAQNCMSHGIMVNWRTPDFCPMKCPAGMEYRLDASCQRQCGAQLGAQGTCDEEPAEGCVCKGGLYRQGNKCVLRNQCGCRVLDDDGNFVKQLQPGGSVVLPGCSKKVICKRMRGGSMWASKVNFKLPAYGVCTDDLPPRVTCGRGTRNVATASAVQCQRNTLCSNNFKDKYGIGVCIRPKRYTQPFAKASKVCNQVSGTLVYVDTVEKIEAIRRILQKNYWAYMHVAGKVRAFYKSGKVVFKPASPGGRAGSIAWANTHFHSAFLNKVVLASCVVAEQIPKEGLELGVMAELKKGRVVFKAMETHVHANFVCEQFP